MAAGYSFASMACKSDELLLGALSTVYKTRAAAASGNQKNRFSLDANKNLFKWRLLTMHQPRQQVPPFWFFLSFSLSLFIVIPFFFSLDVFVHNLAITDVSAIL